MYACHITVDNRATKAEVSENLEAAKSLVAGPWVLWALKDGRFRGSGYGWTFDNSVIPYINGANGQNEKQAICIKKSNNIYLTILFSLINF